MTANPAARRRKENMTSSNKSESQIEHSASDMMLSAELVGIRYVKDDVAGFTRKRTKNGFRYLDKTGKPLKDPAHLHRIKTLAIPPAWTEVWISPWQNSHLQATGRDLRQRKQYRYHERWRQIRDEVKYERMMNFGLHLPKLRETIALDMQRHGLCKEKVLATIVHLLQLTMMRIGNEEYARTNHSYGITTLRNKHVQIDGTSLEFRFRGKSKVDHLIKLTHPKLARVVKNLRDLPGQELFQYLDKQGVRHTIGSAEVNGYLQTLTGEYYTAKDFRTWSGTAEATLALLNLGKAASEHEAKKNIAHAVALAAKKLGNTPTICKKCYVHPAVIDAYMDGSMFSLQLADKQANSNKNGSKTELNSAKLDSIEQLILKLLEHYMAQATSH